MLTAVSILWAPQFVCAQVIFSEVMYDLRNGSDSGREWVEVQNTGGESINLATHKLTENKINHDIKLSRGKATIATGEYAVIASDSKKFISDWPAFSGNLLDSSFSLSNTGESLVLRDAKLADVDTLTYSDSMGGAGDGNSLQRNGLGLWLRGAPTPGFINTEISTTSSPEKVVQTPQVLAPSKVEKDKVIARVTTTLPPPERNQSAPVSVVAEKPKIDSGGEIAVLNPPQTQINSSVFTIWLVGLLMVIGFAVGGFLFANQLSEGKQKKEADEADEYEIIE